MNIRLNSHSEQILKEELESGRFHSPEEVIERALESLHSRAQDVTHERTRPSLEEFRHFLDALAEGSEKIPALPTTAFSRESIYQDHP
jgi:Arc/MetJ-type ribon-helix-helix transcriptional regulator